jgi:hypothetical protein
MTTRLTPPTVLRPPRLWEDGTSFCFRPGRIDTLRGTVSFFV